MDDIVHIDRDHDLHERQERMKRWEPRTIEGNLLLCSGLACKRAQSG
jgi:hypothetical protein